MNSKALFYCGLHSITCNASDFFNQRLGNADYFLIFCSIGYSNALTLNIGYFAIRPRRGQAVTAHQVRAQQQRAQNPGRHHAAAARASAFCVAFCQFAHYHVAMFCFAPDHFVNSVHVAPPESISFFILSFALLLHNLR